MLILRSFNRFILISLALLGLSVSSTNAAVILDQSFFSGSDTTIDFETFPSVSGTVPGFTALTNQYNIFDVLFSSEQTPNALQTTDASDSSGRFLDPFRILPSISGGGVPTSGIRYASGDQYLNLTTSDMRVDFTTGATALGMFVIDNDFSTARIQAFDNIGNLLETVVVAQTSEGGSAYYGVDVTGTGSSISYFILDGNNGIDLDSTFIDDLSIRSVSNVPLPATVWLFGSGLLGLIGFSKRRKAA